MALVRCVILECKVHHIDSHSGLLHLVELVVLLTCSFVISLDLEKWHVFPRLFVICVARKLKRSNIVVNEASIEVGEKIRFGLQ